MTAHEAAGAVEADKTQKQQRAQKEKEIEQRYEAELATLNAEDPESLTFKPLRQVSHINDLFFPFDEGPHFAHP